MILRALMLGPACMYGTVPTTAYHNICRKKGWDGRVNRVNTFIDEMLAILEARIYRVTVCTYISVARKRAGIFYFRFLERRG